MARQILVPVSGSDAVEEIISHLDEIAQPGTRVVFFVRYPVNGFVEWFADHWITVNSARHAMLAGIQLQTKYSWPAQTRLAEIKLAPALQVLQEKRVDTKVEIYTGNLTEVIEAYVHGSHPHALPPSEGSGRLIKRVLSRLSRLGVKPPLPPILVLSPLDEADVSTGSHAA